MDELDRRSWLKVLGAVPIAGATTGCLGGGGTGTLATQVTDQPGDIGDFDSCVVSIVGMWLGPSGATDGTGTDDGEPGAATGTEGGGDGSTGREYHEYDEPQSADLVDLQGESTQLVDERDLPVAEYAFLQLDTDGVDATLADGSDATVEVPGEAPLTFNVPFEIRDGERTVFTGDFTPVKRGPSGGYLLQPVAGGIDVTYEA